MSSAIHNRHESGTHAAHDLRFTWSVSDESNPRRPTVKQIYALAATLCERAGEQFPQTMAEASMLLDRLRGKQAEQRA